MTTDLNALDTRQGLTPADVALVEAVAALRKAEQCLTTLIAQRIEAGRRDALDALRAYLWQTGIAADDLRHCLPKGVAVAVLAAEDGEAWGELAIRQRQGLPIPAELQRRVGRELLVEVA